MLGTQFMRHLLIEGEAGSIHLSSIALCSEQQTNMCMTYVTGLVAEV